MTLQRTQWYSKHLWCHWIVNVSSKRRNLTCKEKKSEASVHCRMDRIHQCTACFQLIFGECLWFVLCFHRFINYNVALRNGTGMVLEIRKLVKLIRKASCRRQILSCVWNAKCFNSWHTAICVNNKQLVQSKANLREGKYRLAFPPSHESHLATGQPSGLSSSHFLRYSWRPA